MHLTFLIAIAILIIAQYILLCFRILSINENFPLFNSAPLIGQLGKNYQNNYDKQITGDELLALALHKVKESQLILGGKIVYLECEDKEKLTEFYSRNGFCNFGQRKLDKDETLNLSGDYLIQMLRYMD